MGPDDRCLGVLQALFRRLIRGMRQVDEHSQAVHLVNEEVSELACKL